MSGAPEPVIAVIIPARNEADVIGRAITSLLQQSEGAPSLSAGVGDRVGAWNNLHIFVVDDNSTDGTADAARAAGAPPWSTSLADRVGEAEWSRVTVIPGRPLPAGWSGKLWAVEQGVEQALLLAPDFLLLTDADIEHAPENLATLVGVAEGGGYDLASFMVKLHCRSVAEKLLIPAFVFFFFMLYPPEWVRKSPTLSSKGRTRTLGQAQGRLWGSNTAGAAGGCMLIRPAALERIGGIAAIRREIIDDCRLARVVKRSGGKVWLGVEGNESGHDFSRAGRATSYDASGLQPAAAETHSLRPYKSFGAIERMIARTAFNQLKHSFWLLLGTVVGMLLLYLLPIALLASGSARLAFVGAASYALMSAAYFPMARFYRLNPLWTLSLPLSAVFYTAATLHSAVNYWRGHGGEWKGRAQDVAKGPGTRGQDLGAGD